MNRSTLLAIAVGSILGTALPRAYADDSPSSAPGAVNQQQGEDIVRRDIARDQADIQADQQDLQRDRADLRLDRQDLRGDRQGLRSSDNDATARSATPQPTTGPVHDQRSDDSGRRAERQDMAKDRRDIARDQADIHADQKDLARDRADLRADRQDLRSDRQDFREDRQEFLGQDPRGGHDPSAGTDAPRAGIRAHDQQRPGFPKNANRWD